MYTTPECVNALTGLYLIATSSPYYTYSNQRRCVNALTGLYLIATKSSLQRSHPRNLVSMPSRAYTSLLLSGCDPYSSDLISVSMPSRAYTSLLPLSVSVEIHCMIRCQCPHGLVPHFYAGDKYEARLEWCACQCPHGLVPHFYSLLQYLSRISIRVSMPSRASTSFLPSTCLRRRHV